MNRLRMPSLSLVARAPLKAALVSALLLGLGSPLTAQWAPSGKALDLSRSSGSAEVTCSGNQKTTIEAREIAVDGIGILAQGNCELELVDVDVTSRANIALLVRDQAKVTIRNSRFEGRVAALGLDGSAEVDTGESEFWGGVGLSRSQNISFTETSANGFWQKIPSEIVIDG